MKNFFCNTVILSTFLLFLGLPVSEAAQSNASQEQTIITLPSPDEKAGADLFEAIRSRTSIRAYSNKIPAREVLADVLWAAGGQKTPGGKWVIPYAWKTEPTCKIYLTCAGGTYLYNGAENTLQLVVSEDLRGEIGEQDFVSTAPYVILLVASPEPLLSRIKDAKEEEINKISYISYGAIMQDIYLAATAKGLATCYVASVKENVIKDVLKLPDNEVFFGLMTLGYPKE